MLAARVSPAAGALTQPVLLRKHTVAYVPPDSPTVGNEK